MGKGKLYKSVFIVILVLCQAGYGQPLIYTTYLEKDLEEIGKQLPSSLSREALSKLNNHWDNLSPVKNKEFIVDQNVVFSSCSYSVKKGDAVAKLLRKYGYRRPYSLGLIGIAKKYNPHLKNLNSIEVGDQLRIPFIYVKQNSSFVEEQASCEELIAQHAQFPFLVRGPEARLENAGGKTVFHPGLDLKGASSQRSTLARVSIDNKEESERFSVPMSQVVNKSEGETRRISSETKRVSSETRQVSSETRQVSSETRQVSSEVVFKLGGVYDSLHGKNDDSTLVSDLQYNFEIKWSQLWTKHWHTFLGFGHMARSFEEIDSEGQTLENRAFNQGHFLVGAKYLWQEQSFLSLSMNMAEELYYRQKSENVYKVEKDRSFVLRAQVSQEIYSNGSLGLSLLGELGYLGKGGKDFSGGIEYGVGSSMKHQITETSFLSGSLLYRKKDLESTWFKYEQRWLELMVEYGWRF